MMVLMNCDVIVYTARLMDQGTIPLLLFFDACRKLPDEVEMKTESVDVLHLFCSVQVCEAETM